MGDKPEDSTALPVPTGDTELSGSLLDTAEVACPRAGGEAGGADPHSWNAAPKACCFSFFRGTVKWFLITKEICVFQKIWEIWGNTQKIGITHIIPPAKELHTPYTFWHVYSQSLHGCAFVYVFHKRASPSPCFLMHCFCLVLGASVHINLWHVEP